MYNIRKKLWILTILLFSSAALIAWIFPANDEYTPVAPTGAVTAQAQNENEPLFGGDGERFAAHRGYSGYAPENSISAFEFAGKMGFWGIETDISETSDGAFVCIHDDTLDRTTDGEGKVTDFTLEKLGEFSIDTGNYLKRTENRKIPTFEEYLDICGEYGCTAVVEIKTIKNYDAFLSVIYERGMDNNCVIIGAVKDLKEIRSRDSKIPVLNIGYYPEPYTDNIKAIEEIDGEKGVLYNYPQVDKKAVKATHDKGLYCAVWAVDEEDVAEEYIEAGVDFIVTNEIPARLEHMVNENE